MDRVSDKVYHHIDDLLDSLTFEWQSLPEIAAEIDQWDPIDQLNFVEEWPIQEDRLMFLERYVARRTLAPDQLTRYEELKRIIRKNRPIIRALQNS